MLKISYLLNRLSEFWSDLHCCIQNLKIDDTYFDTFVSIQFEN